MIAGPDMWVEPDPYCGLPVGLLDVEHADDLAFWVISLVAMLIDLYKEKAPRGLEGEVRPVLETLKLNGLVVDESRLAVP